MRVWFRQTWCWLTTGHDWLIVPPLGRGCRCMHCGAETPGWHRSRTAVSS